jgi:hypothetical protein
MYVPDNFLVSFFITYKLQIPAQSYDFLVIQALLHKVFIFQLHYRTAWDWLFSFSFLTIFSIVILLSRE